MIDALENSISLDSAPSQFTEGYTRALGRHALGRPPFIVMPSFLNIDPFPRGVVQISTAVKMRKSRLRLDSFAGYVGVSLWPQKGATSWPPAEE
jgi:hypothetical protein